MTTNNALITRSDIDQIIHCNAHAGRASWIKHPRSKVLAAAYQLGAAYWAAVGAEVLALIEEEQAYCA